MNDLDKKLKFALLQKRAFGRAELSRFCKINIKTVIRHEKSALKKIKENYGKKNEN